MSALPGILFSPQILRLAPSCGKQQEERWGLMELSPPWAPARLLEWLAANRPEWCKTTLLRFSGVLKCSQWLHNMASGTGPAGF